MNQHFEEVRVKSTEIVEKVKIELFLDCLVYLTLKYDFKKQLIAAVSFKTLVFKTAASSFSSLAFIFLNMVRDESYESMPSNTYKKGGNDMRELK